MGDKGSQIRIFLADTGEEDITEGGDNQGGNQGGQQTGGELEG